MGEEGGGRGGGRERGNTPAGLRGGYGTCCELRHTRGSKMRARPRAGRYWLCRDTPASRKLCLAYGGSIFA